jgi:uncharacterized protein (DUF1015 family)
MNCIVKRMVKIRPLNGYVARQDIAGKLIAPPYDVYSTVEARALAEGNEYSFFRVNMPEIELPAEMDSYADAVYEHGKVTLDRFVDNGWLVKEETPTLYVYGLNMGDLE